MSDETRYCTTHEMRFMQRLDGTWGCQMCDSSVASAPPEEPTPRRVGHQCPTCKHQSLYPLRFDDHTRIRTWTCLWPSCKTYRLLVDEDDGDHGRGDCE